MQLRSWSYPKKLLFQQFVWSSLAIFFLLMVWVDTTQRRAISLPVLGGWIFLLGLGVWFVFRSPCWRISPTSKTLLYQQLWHKKEWPFADLRFSWEPISTHPWKSGSPLSYLFIVEIQHTPHTIGIITEQDMHHLQEIARYHHIPMEVKHE